MTGARRSSVQLDQEEESRRQFRDHLPVDWKITDIIPDLGEDFLIRIYDQGNSTPLSFYVQLKSVQNIEKYRLKSGVISYPFDVTDLEHWEDNDPPVYLIVWE